MGRQAVPDFIDIPGPDDFHVHVRQGAPLPGYVRTIAKACSRALIMPNTVPPITTVEAIAAYRDEILRAAPSLTPLMTFKVLSSINPKDVSSFKRAGAVAGKYYPAGVTTNAEDGVVNPGDVEDLLCAMEESDLVLCIHAEATEEGILQRERAFLPVVEDIVKNHQSLRIVVEHVSDAGTIDFVRRMPATVAATVTVHHLLYTIEDLLGSGIRPHLYCKPLLKQTADCEAIQNAVLSGSDRFFYGSDSAPHGVGIKECACGAAGVYSAPTAIPLLIEFFEKHDAFSLLPSFVGGNGAEFYRLSPPTGVKRYMREVWEAPTLVDGAVPLAAGERLSWRLSD